MPLHFCRPCHPICTIIRSQGRKDGVHWFSTTCCLSSDTFHVNIYTNFMAKRRPNTKPNSSLKGCDSFLWNFAKACRNLLTFCPSCRCEFGRGLLPTTKFFPKMLDGLKSRQCKVSQIFRPNSENRMDLIMAACGLIIWRPCRQTTFEPTSRNTEQPRVHLCDDITVEDTGTKTRKTILCSEKLQRCKLLTNQCLFRTPSHYWQLCYESPKLFSRSTKTQCRSRNDMDTLTTGIAWWLEWP